VTDDKTALGSSSFEVGSEELDGVTVIQVRGELDLSTAPQLEALIEEAAAGSPKPLLIDLSECPFIDSTGIALIVRTWQQRTGNGERGGFALCSADDQVRRLLEITGLISSVPLHEARDEAVAALR
jgi:anti-sigma B factor antagonist